MAAAWPSRGARWKWLNCTAKMYSCSSPEARKVASVPATGPSPAEKATGLYTLTEVIQDARGVSGLDAATRAKTQRTNATQVKHLGRHSTQKIQCVTQRPLSFCVHGEKSLPALEDVIDRLVPARAPELSCGPTREQWVAEARHR